MNRRHFCNSALALAVSAAIPWNRAFAADEIAAVTGSGTQTTLARNAIQELKDSLRGPLLLPGDTGYDQARRVLNASIDKHPALIVQPTGAADVQAAVNFARDHDLLLAVKCGGHSYSGRSTCEGGLQIDLSRFRSARVDPTARIAYVAGGSLLGELDHEAMAFGLVTTAGTVSHTGVGGLTLGAGFGRLARRFGLALDNLRAVDIVTAGGKVLHASADENADLYWGVRGGGGNFGVVTSFEFMLHPMERQVIGGRIIFPIERARELLAFYRDFTLAAPDDLYVDAIMGAPAGKPGAFVFDVCYSGPAAKADAVLEPLRKLGNPIKDSIAPVDYTVLQRSGDRTDPRNEGEYLKSGFIDHFDEKLVRTIIDGFESRPDRDSVVFFQHAGGAVGRTPVSATAFPHRRATHNMFTAVTWPLGTDATPHVRYLKDYWAKLQPFTDGYYTNEVGDEGQHVVDENYQGNLPRLRQVKKKYDPGNLFRLNANVLPA